jgi:hypothetical protein
VADRIMLDSVDWQVVLKAAKDGHRFAGIPVTMAAGYLDGLYAWPAAAWEAFHDAGLHNRSLVAITVLGSGGEAGRAGAGDSEPGDMTPAAAAAWAEAEHKAGHWPVIYCDRSWKPQIAAEAAAKGLHAGTHFGWWVATLDGTLTDSDGKPLRDEPGVVAIQYLGAAAAGINADVSLVTSATWRQPAPPPPPPGLDGQVVWYESGTLHTRGVISSDGGKTWR